MFLWNCLQFEHPFMCMLPALLIISFDMVQGVYWYYRGEIQKAKTFILAGVLIILIGSSSCVTIRFRNTQPKKTEHQKTK